MTQFSTEPLYRDPIEDGAADPTLIWNANERAWWMVYTARRVRSAPDNGVAWVHGTGLGVASSVDHGRTWTYRGELAGLDTEWGTNTYWAPEIIAVDGIYHMYVSYIRGVPSSFIGPPRTIRHYTSPDLVAWTYQSDLPLSSDKVIDACVLQRPDGGYRMWYKDEDRDRNIWCADSPDLYTWTVRGPAIVETHPLEGPYVFELGGAYWMLVDAYRQDLYRSEDLTTWVKAGEFLDIASGRTSGRCDDLGPGLHGMAVVADGVAWIVYFTHPDRHTRDLTAANQRRSSIQVASLHLADGQPVVARDPSVSIDLTAAEPSP